MSRLSDRWLFWGPTLIWASTWHVILYQLDSGVPVLNSVAWRFALAALMLFAFARWRGDSLAMPRSAHVLMLATGIVQYSGNYWSVTHDLKGMDRHTGTDPSVDICSGSRKPT